MQAARMTRILIVARNEQRAALFPSAARYFIYNRHKIKELIPRILRNFTTRQIHFGLRDGH